MEQVVEVEDCGSSDVLPLAIDVVHNQVLVFQCYGLHQGGHQTHASSSTGNGNIGQL